MRIITGTARGVKLETLEGEATRPTAERVKEALFSMIQFDLDEAEVLDLFAGSGQLGLEALSRGAERAVFTDMSSDATAIVKANAQKTRLFDKCRILTMDYKDYIRAAAGKNKFDFIFIDPPYALKLVPTVLEKIKAADILSENGIAICETEDEEILTTDELRSSFEIIKQVRYGRVYLTLVKAI
jgi:16S rRNA (guanine(966)-N(2))-methyltransferase RsmD